MQDWSKHANEGIRYYSGAAFYKKTFRFTRAGGSRLYLDLGKVGVMAEVTLNGRNLGILWNAPYRVDVTDAIQLVNTLEINIVNLWVNRMIGDEHLPDDMDRRAAPIDPPKAWPKWVQEGRSSPTGRFTFTSVRSWRKDNPLVASGLLGPVWILAVEKIGSAREFEGGAI